MRFALVLLVLLAACKSEVAPPTPAEPAVPPAVAAPEGASAAVYYCPDSTEIFALFTEDSTGTSTVALAIGDERIRMRQTESTSGVKYADSAATTTLWNTGTDVIFDRNGAAVTCATTNPAAAPSTVHGATQ